MPKLKTHKATSSRVRVTKKGKLMKRTSGNDHFNAREAGKEKHHKRNDALISKSNAKNVKRSLPYAA